MANAGPEFNETDDFDDYNPHPYQGGYDISLTYGHPLPPSPSICYPLSYSEPAAPAPPLPPPSISKEPLPESDHRPPYDYSEPGYRPEPYSLDLDHFGFWPFLTPENRDVEELGYWSQWRRAADYLFGYSEGYGERRIGVDSYGIPIYALKKQSDQSLTLQIEPATDQKLDYYEGHHESWLSSHDEKKHESYSYAYNRHYYEEPLSVQEESIETTLPQRLTYHEVYGEQVYPELKWHSSYSGRGDESNFFGKPQHRGDESNFFGNPQHAYERHYNEQPLCVELEPYKSTWSQNLSYHEVYDGEVSSPQHAYERHYNEQPLCVELEPYKPTWSQTPSYHEVYDREVSSPQHAYERHYNEQPLCVELEPYKPTWSQTLNYHDVYDGEVSLESSWYSSAYNGMGDVSNIFGDPNYAYGRHYSDQPLGVQLEPFKPTWSQNPSVYEPYIEEGDDYFRENGTQYFSHFLKYSQYDE